MNNNYLSVGLLVLVVGGMSTVRADDTPLRLRDAIETALVQRKEMNIARAESIGAAAKVSESKGIFLPTLDVYSDSHHTTNYDEFSGYTVSGKVNDQEVSATITPTVPVYETETGATFSLNVYAGGSHTAQLRQARAEQLTVQAQQSIAMRNTILEVVTAYWQLKQAQVEHALATDALVVAKAEERVAGTKNADGNMSELDYEKSSLHTLEAQARYTNAEVNRQERWEQYRKSIGLSTGDAANDKEMALIDDPDVTIDKWLSSYLVMSRPDVVKANANVDITVAKEHANQAEYLPRVDMYVRYRWVGRDDNTMGDAFSNQSRRDNMIGLQLRWNLFNGFRNSYRDKQARADFYVAKWQADQASEKVSDAINDGRRQVARLQNDLSLAEKQYNIVQLETRIASMHLKSNKISQLAYRSQQLAEKEAAANLQKVKMDLAIANISLQLME